MFKVSNKETRIIIAFIVNLERIPRCFFVVSIVDFE